MSDRSPARRALCLKSAPAAAECTCPTLSSATSWAIYNCLDMDTLTAEMIGRFRERDAPDCVADVSRIYTASILHRGLRCTP